MKKSFVIIMAAVLAACFSGCRIEIGPERSQNERSSVVSAEESSEEQSEDESSEQSQQEPVEESSESEEPLSESSVEETNPNRAGEKSLYKLTAEKIGSLTSEQAKTISEVEAKNNSIIFKSSDKYGVIFTDGNISLEAKYTNIHEEALEGREQKNTYFTEMSIPLESTDVSKPASYNCVGLINDKGEQIIPEKYASIEILNDRYAKVVTVSDVTTSKDDALVYVTEKMFSFTADEGDILLKGTWEIFDMTTGKVVNGVKGNKPININAKGKFIYADSKYYDDQGKEQGNDVQVFDYGYYVVSSGDTAVLYNNEGNKVFEYDPHSQSVTKALGNDLFVVTDIKEYKNYIADSSNKRLSDAMEGISISDVYGNYIVMYKDSKYFIGDKTGKNLLDKEFKYVNYNEAANVFICDTDNECEYYDADLGFIGSMKTDDGSTVTMKYQGIAYSGSSGSYTVHLLNGKTVSSDKGVTSGNMFIYYKYKSDVYESINGETLVSNPDEGKIEICSKAYKMIKFNSDGTADIYEFKFAK